MGLFITFEGGEGAGKSTQARLLAQRLRETGHDVLELREPGGTPLGDYLRDWLKATHRPLTAEAELLLFTAARAELVQTVLRPALARKRVVVLDRYADSTTVYQGDGRGLDRESVAAANNVATHGLQPDLTVLMDVPPEIGLARAARRSGEEDSRRFEEADFAFHERVRAGFLRLAAEAPGRWLIVDATGPVESSAAQIWERVQAAFARLHGAGGRAGKA